MTRGHSCDILTKSQAAFYLGTENLSRVKFKVNRLICLVEEISRQDNIQNSAEVAVMDWDHLIKSIE